MKKSLVVVATILVVICLCPVLARGQEIPGTKSTSLFVVGGGWSVKVNLLNTSPDPIKFNMLFFDQAGQGLKVRDVYGDLFYATSIGQPIQPGGSWEITLDSPSPTPQHGSLMVRVFTPTTVNGELVFVPKDFELSSVIYLRNPAGELIAQAPVFSMAPMSDVFLAFTANSKTKERTGVAIANHTWTPTVALLEVVDNNGIVLGRGQTKTLPANAQMAMFVDEMVSIPDGTSGRLRIQSYIPIVVAGLAATVNSRGEFLISTERVFPGK